MSSIIDNWHGAHNDDLSKREEVRKTGGIFPEQQTFLGATVKSFSVNAGTGSTPTTLNVELIEDSGGRNPTIDDPNKNNGVYDPYHHNKIGDGFSPPGVGMPVFFVYSNPRVTIKEAYSDNFVLPDRESVIKFGGLLQSFHRSSSVSGHSISVTVTDPREILASIFLILNHSDDKVGAVEKNLYNVFGFLENNPTLDTRAIFKTYTRNTVRRGGSGFFGDDMYHNSLPDQDDGFDYFSNTGYANKFPITGTGMSRRSTYGIPYYRVMQAISAMDSALPNDEFSGFSGDIVFRGLRFSITFGNLPPLNPMYMVDHDNVDVLSFLLEIAEASGHEISISMSPKYGLDDRGIPFGGNIEIYFLDRTQESGVGQIRKFLNNNFPKSVDKDGNEFTIAEKEDLGYEMTNPTTSKVLFGGNRVDMYAFTSNHDDGRFDKAINGQGGSTANQIIPYYGLLSENVVTPTKGYGDWMQILLDSSGLGAFGVGNYYVATQAELRYALAGFKAWKKLLEYYNGNYFTVFNGSPRQKHQDILVGGAGNPNFRVQDGQNGDHLKCVKAPRCLFTNDVGFYNNGQPINPCCPPHGFPLYYNRAVAIGLTMQKVFDDRSSVVADLNILKANGSDDVGFQKIRNALLEKYKKLGRVRRLTRAELDAVKALQTSGGGFDGKYLNSIISSMSGSMIYPKANRTARKENYTKVFNFVKSVAEECYGKKWLVRIPPKPNYKFYSNDQQVGLKLASNNRVYLDGFFGISPVPQPNPAIRDQLNPSNRSFVAISNDPTYSLEQSKFKSGLITNYNPISDSLVHNYMPSTEGGFLAYDIYTKGVETAMIPADLTGFGSNHRIKAYVRYDHSNLLNLSNSNSKVYSEFVGTRTNVVPSKDLTIDDPFTSATSPKSQIAFMPVDLDEKYYFLPTTKMRNVGRFGAKFKTETYYIPDPVGLDASGNIPDNAGNIKTNIQLIPTYQSNGNVNIADFSRESGGKILAYPNLDYAYALITQPSVVSVKGDNLGGVKKQRHAVATYPGYFSDEHLINTVSHIKVNRRLDFDNYGSSLTFYNSDSLFSSPIALKPDVVVLPLENQQACYGPWYNGPVKTKDENNQTVYKYLKDLGGKVDIQTDASLTPWNYGSYGLMNVAGQARVAMMNTLYLASEKGSISYPGLPMGNVDVGFLAAQGGPILDSISLDVGIDGIRSTYRFQTYSRSFALVQKQQQKQIDRLKTESLKASKMNFELLSKGLLKGKFAGSVPPAGISKPYTPAADLYYNPPSPNNLSMATMSETKNNSNQRVTGNGQVESLVSSVNSEGLQEAISEDTDFLSHAKENYNGAVENMSEKQVAVSRQYHHLLPAIMQAELEQMDSLYSSPADPYNIEKISLTHWS